MAGGRYHHFPIFFMKILIFSGKIKWVIVALTLPNYAASEYAFASPPMGSLPEKPSTTVNPTMAIVLVCLISAFFMICVVSAYFRHCAERQLRLAASTTQGSETGSMRSVVHGLDPAMINTFACFLYSSVKGIKIGQTVLECAVCLNEFQDHETLRLLPKCSHVFHRECIDTWLASHVTCPVCRADLVIRPGEPIHVITEPTHNYPVDQEIDYASTEFLLPIEAENIQTATTEMKRSHSTGHSVIVRPVGNFERYTLRLPDEARGLLVNVVTSLPTSPHLAFSKETSGKMTFRSISVGSTSRLDYVQYERSNPQRPRGNTSRVEFSSSHVVNGNDPCQNSSSPGLFRSVRSPFGRFFQRSNRDFDTEQRSGDRTSPNVEV